MGFCFSWYRKARNDNLIVMDACCEAKSEEIEKFKADHKKVLKIVLTLNVLLFIVEVTAGFVAPSTALRADDLNMRSTWLCSRNDIMANLSVLVAAGGVSYFRTVWPDVVVGGAIAVLFFRTGLVVLRESVHEYQELRRSAEASL